MSSDPAIVQTRKTAVSRKQVGRIAVSGVVPSMSRVVCSLQVTGRQEEPMCRSGITQCMNPVNAEAL